MSYISYGPFTSYAPTYDSSFANISKDDSDLIYSFYGEESSLQGADRYVLRKSPFMLTHSETRGIPAGLWSRCAEAGSSLEEVGCWTEQPEPVASCFCDKAISRRVMNLQLLNKEICLIMCLKWVKMDRYQLLNVI